MRPGMSRWDGGPTRRGFALLLKFYTRVGRFPWGRGELPEEAVEAERRPELVRDELLVRCRTERIEPPAAGRIDRIVRSVLRQAEQTLTGRIVARLPVDVAERLRALVAVDVPDDDTGEESVLALIKSVRGNVSLESMLTRSVNCAPSGRSGCLTGCSPTLPRGCSPAGGRGRWWNLPRTCATIPSR